MNADNQRRVDRLTREREYVQEIHDLLTRWNFDTEEGSALEHAHFEAEAEADAQMLRDSLGLLRDAYVRTAARKP